MRIFNFACPRSVAPDDEKREVMQHWRMAESGMAGPRITKLDEPDDLVAHRLLEAADQAMSRGDWQRGVNILRLVVRDYRQSQEAALARTVIDRLGSRGQ